MSDLQKKQLSRLAKARWAQRRADAAALPLPARAANEDRRVAAPVALSAVEFARSVGAESVTVHYKNSTETVYIERE
jgi:hypothetical protein